MTRGIAFFALALVPATVWAQDTLNDWSALNPSRLATVYILDDTGQETTGRFLRLNADSIALLIDGREQRFDAVRVQRLDQRGDSLKNGLYIGAIIGAALGLFADTCHERSGRLCHGGRKAASVAGIAGFYAGVGLAIDALRHGRTTLYEAPVKQAPGLRR